MREKWMLLADVSWPPRTKMKRFPITSDSVNVVVLWSFPSHSPAWPLTNCPIRSTAVGFVFPDRIEVFFAAIISFIYLPQLS